MANKKQIHLKTISFQDTFLSQSTHLPFNSTKKKETLIPSKMRSFFYQKKQIKAHFKPRKQSQRLSICSSDFQIKKKFDEISINRQTMLAFLSKQVRPKSRSNRTQSMQFMKKDPLMKCTNQFKFFLNSAISTVSDEQITNLHEFYKKITQVFGQTAINEGARKYKQRAKTENTTMTLKNSKFTRKLRPQSVSSTHIQKEKKIPSQNKLQPWETEYLQSNNFDHSDF